MADGRRRRLVHDLGIGERFAVLGGAFECFACR